MAGQYGLWQFGRGTGNYHPYSGFYGAKENAITTKTIKAIKETFKHDNVFVRKVHGGGYQRSGLPDLYVHVRGIAVWIEMKRPGADTTALQKEVLEELKAAGAYCGTASSPAQAVGLIRDALRDYEQKRRGESK